MGTPNIAAYSYSTRQYAEIECEDFVNDWAHHLPNTVYIYTYEACKGWDKKNNILYIVIWKWPLCDDINFIKAMKNRVHVAICEQFEKMIS